MKLLRADSDIQDGAIYRGWVWHHRYLPVVHKFRYRVFMVYLDLAKADSVFAKSLLWGTRWFHVARFKREDYFALNNNYEQSVENAVRYEVQQQLGRELSGPICLLTNLRYFGYITNPISCYYCFDDASRLQALLIEVTNTPWAEKHHYVLDLSTYDANECVQFEKKMHVSPFMPMDRYYQWRGAVPAQTLRYSLASVVKSSSAEQSDRQFNSGVVLHRVPVTSGTLNKVLVTYPIMTVKVTLAIYWQALKLWIKKVPFVPHPKKTTA